MDNFVIGVRTSAGQRTFIFSKTSRDLWAPWENSCLFYTSIHTLGSIVEFSLLQDTKTHSELNRRIYLLQDTQTHSGLHRRIYLFQDTQPLSGLHRRIYLFQDTQTLSGLHRRIYLLQDAKTHSGLHRSIFSSSKRPDPLWVPSKYFVFPETSIPALGSADPHVE